MRRLSVVLPLLFLVGCARSSDRQIDEADPIDRSDDTDPLWSESERTLILVSLDGFRADYRARVDTPNLDRIADEGVAAEALVPVFPTKTFPNHFTQVTGLYPAEHGIVGNSFWDPDLQATFDMSETDSVWWEGGEPIWITAALQDRKTVTMFWPGSETAYGGVRAHHWLPFDGGMANSARVDQLLDWLDEDPRPHFGTLYFSDVDRAGHAVGPDHADVDLAVAKVDGDLGLLLDGLEERELLDVVDLIVVSDHGMRGLSRDRAIFLDDHIDVDDYWINTWGPYASIEPKGRQEREILVDLAALPHATCSDASTRAPELRFTGNARISPILCLAEPGWGITSRDWFEATPDDLTGGTHGFDAADPQMHGIFLARGPHIVQGTTHPAFSSVHLYALMAELLEIEPSPNSGDPAATSAVRR